MEMGIQDAVEAPRFAVKADTEFLPGWRQMPAAAGEPALASPVADTLTAMGHDVAMVGPLAIGAIQGARIYENGAVMAGADPRRMAMAAGF